VTKFQHYKNGQIFGIRYTFESRGNRIPEHAHDAELAHNLIVIRGSVMLVTPHEQRICMPGIHDFNWSQPHEIVALEDDCETFHLFLSGQPIGYISLPDNELRGFLANT
jgi:hypothetical protein